MTHKRRLIDEPEDACLERKLTELEALQHQALDATFTYTNKGGYAVERAQPNLKEARECIELYVRLRGLLVTKREDVTKMPQDEAGQRKAAAELREWADRIDPDASKEVR